MCTFILVPFAANQWKHHSCINISNDMQLFTILSCRSETNNMNNNVLQSSI